MADLREVITKGLFIHTPDGDDCRFCDYGPACGAKAHDNAGKKLDAPELAPYGRLRNHE